MSIANVRIGCIHSEAEWKLTLQASPSTGTIALVDVRTSVMSVTHVNISFISTEARSELAFQKICSLNPIRTFTFPKKTAKKRNQTRQMFRHFRKYFPRDIWDAAWTGDLERQYL